MTREQKLDAVYRLFKWLNSVAETGEAMKIEDIRAIFTDKAPMMLNGQKICYDHATHFKHALDLQSQMAKWRFNIPFEREIVEGDQVVGYYTVDYEDKAGRVGQMLDLCIFTVSDNKISSITELVHFDGQNLDIESFDG
ncbi:MAG: hypothetical protein AAF562_00065 [Pseudomonadota bacterium]